MERELSLSGGNACQEPTVLLHVVQVHLEFVVDLELKLKLGRRDVGSCQVRSF
jgi:hypothetical protein